MKLEVGKPYKHIKCTDVAFIPDDINYKYRLADPIMYRGHWVILSSQAKYKFEDIIKIKKSDHAFWKKIKL